MGKILLVHFYFIFYTNIHFYFIVYTNDDNRGRSWAIPWILECWHLFVISCASLVVEQSREYLNVDIWGFFFLFSVWYVCVELLILVCMFWNINKHDHSLFSPRIFTYSPFGMYNLSFITALVIQSFISINNHLKLDCLNLIRSCRLCFKRRYLMCFLAHIPFLRLIWYIYRYIILQKYILAQNIVDDMKMTSIKSKRISTAAHIMIYIWRKFKFN